MGNKFQFFNKTGQRHVPTKSLGTTGRKGTVPVKTGCLLTLKLRNKLFILKRILCKLSSFRINNTLYKHQHEYVNLKA